MRHCVGQLQPALLLPGAARRARAARARLRAGDDGPCRIAGVSCAESWPQARARARTFPCAPQPPPLPAPARASRQAPWGGIKNSGFGRELGEYGLDNYLSVKQVTTYVSPNTWEWYSPPSKL